MMKYFSFIAVFFLCSCGPIKDDKYLASSKPKIALIFPGGGGAMQVSLKILSLLEESLAPKSLIGQKIDIAAGISSGSITAALIVNNNEKKSANDILQDIPSMTGNVFASLKTLADNIKMGENYSDKDMADLLKGIVQNKGISNLPLNIIGKYSKDITKVVSDDFSTNLKTKLDEQFLNVDFKSKEAQKIVAVAAYKQKPVVFQGDSLEPYDGYMASYEENLSTALLASSSLPVLFKKVSIKGSNKDGPLKDLETLQDGGLVTGIDPSKFFYEHLSQNVFDTEDVIMIYVSNGAQVDGDFRKSIGLNENDFVKLSQNGRNITFIAIDAKILDENGDDFFSLAVFDSSDKINKLCEKAAIKASQTKAFAKAKEVIENMTSL